MPTLIELDRGEVLVAFMGGSVEGKADTACYTARLHADEEMWAPPQVAVAAKMGTPCWNPVAGPYTSPLLWDELGGM